MSEKLLKGIAVLMLGAIAPAAFAGKAYNDFDPDANFLRYKTFSFLKVGDKNLTGIMRDPASRDRIKNFIGGALELRGMTEVPRDQSHDLDVRYWLALQNKQSEEVYSYPAGWWGGYPAYWGGPWAWSYDEYVVKHYVEGSLLIDLLDPNDKQLVWRTFLEQKIEDRSKAYDQAKRTLYKAFAAYPPSDKDKAKMSKKRDQQATK